MSFIERKYILLLSNRFKNFKQKENLFNFSCPYCGDSHRNKFKARGYFIEKKGHYFYYCHNCNINMNFDKFLFEQDVVMHHQYKIEALKESSNLEKTDNISNTNIQQTSAFPGDRQKSSPLRKLKKVSQLDWDHPVKQYILQRKIPNRYHAKLFYCPRFHQWTNTMVPGKFKEVRDEPRIIIPFIDKKGKMFGYQGRSLPGQSSLRYITIMLDESRSKLFGLDDVDSSKRVYVTEGPFDSMFIFNSVAMAGSDANVPFDNAVMIYDNEPRSKEIVAKIEKSIEARRKVVIWPSGNEYKDINEMVMNKYSIADVKLIIDENTYDGLPARMALSTWRRA